MRLAEFVRVEMAVGYVPFRDHDEFVSLWNEEVDFAIASAYRKYRQPGTKDRDGWEGWDKETDGIRQGWRNQALGALGEQIVAKALNVYPLHEANKGFHADADLTFDVEVKLIGREHYGLRVYDRIPDQYAVVGVVIEPGKERGHPYRIPGWIRAGNGKQLRWQMAPHGRPPMYAVPQAELSPLSSLREALGR